MSNARKGKIARLPRQIRDELNRRLDDGHEAKSLLPWLNSLPEVQAVLANQFGSQPVNEGNLSQWRQGGFADWQKRQEKRDRFLELADNADELAPPDTPAPAAETAARLLSTDFAVAAADLLDAATKPRARWQCLRQLLPELARLRHAEHRAQALALARHSLALAQRRSDRLDAEARARDAEAARQTFLLHAAQDQLIAEMLASPDPSMHALANALIESRHLATAHPVSQASPALGARPSSGATAPPPPQVSCPSASPKASAGSPSTA